jgi:maltooligosyltrehalose trehalohydrolase
MKQTFEVWAPRAKSIEIKTGESTSPLKQEKGGWWKAFIEAAGPATDYSYLIDGDTYPLPDPRSPWQPEGVHGPSRTIDHSRFQWTDQNWQPPAWPKAIVYELHIGTFTPEGTLDAAIQHLPYLKDLGITHVELLPVSAFPGNHGWGYDGVALFAPHQPYGGPEALKRFVNACHQQGLATLLDVVYNHFGPSGNYTGKFGPYVTNHHNTPWGDAVNFEAGGSHEVRRFFCDNALMWLRDYHFDGLRLDAVHAYMDRSAINFMEQLSIEVDVLEAETGRHYVLIAESDLNAPHIIAPRADNGYGLDAQWSDDFHHALVSVLAGDQEGYYADFGTIADIAKALKQAYVYDGKYSAYRDCIHGRPAANLPAWKFLGYSQNHDQVGNRVKGERLQHIAGTARAKIAAALVLTAPFVPMLFQGEEWAASTPFQYFTDHEDHELGRLVTEGRKKEFAAFGWKPEEVPDPQDKATFERSKLNWEETTRPEHKEILDWYKKLIQLRQSHPELTEDSFENVQVSYSEEGKWLAFHHGRIFTACNLSKEAAELPIPPASQILLASNAQVEAQSGKLYLPPDTVAILKTGK